jgi:hypothetical protein
VVRPCVGPGLGTLERLGISGPAPTDSDQVCEALRRRTNERRVECHTRLVLGGCSTLMDVFWKRAEAKQCSVSHSMTWVAS